MWPHSLTIGVGDALVCIGTDDPSLVARLQPWRVDDVAALGLVHLGLETEVSPRWPGGPRSLPQLRTGSDVMLRSRDVAALREGFDRSITALAETPVAGRVPLGAALLRRAERAELVPHNAVAAVSHAWLAAHGWTVTVAHHVTVDPAGPIVHVAAPFGATGEPVEVPLTGWWIAGGDAGSWSMRAPVSAADVARAAVLLREVPAAPAGDAQLEALARLVERMPPLLVDGTAASWRTALGDR